MGYNRFNPSCCCCNDIYGSEDPGRFRISGNTARWYEPGVLATGAQYFDLVNKFLYYAERSSTSILKYSDDLRSHSTVFTISAPLQINYGIAVHPWNQHIYYFVRDYVTLPLPYHGYLFRVNYDGTNNTLLSTIATAGSGLATLCPGIAVSKAAEYVFYTVAYETFPPLTTNSELRRINSDGSGDTVIFNGTGVATVRHLCVDNTNQRVFFDSDITKIRRCNFDGSSPTTIFSAPVGSLALVAVGSWSHKHSRLYFSASDGTLGAAGLYSMQGDGSDIKAEVVYPHIRNEVTGAVEGGGSDALSLQVLKVGCGYETTGAATLGS